MEPSEEIIDKLAWIHIVDAQILCTRSEGQEKYAIPGGKRDLGETDTQALYRQIKQKLSASIDIPSMRFIGIFEAQADGRKPGILTRLTCYSATHDGRLIPASEVTEMVFLNYEDREMVTEVDTLIFDYLKEKEILK
ncbi:MAG: NUDIX domain-containing protein [Pricia sp.]|nr:NUDIX domain-containing protein [Pricia sp.]